MLQDWKTTVITPGMENNCTHSRTGEQLHTLSKKSSREQLGIEHCQLCMKGHFKLCYYLFNKRQGLENNYNYSRTRELLKML